MEWAVLYRRRKKPQSEDRGAKSERERERNAIRYVLEEQGEPMEVFKAKLDD